MIRTRKGRALLREYAREAQEMIYCALNSEKAMSVDYFRRKLRALWIRRAEIFYDGRNEKHPYPGYLYTIDRTMPHTIINDEFMSIGSIRTLSNAIR